MAQETPLYEQLVRQISKQIRLGVYGAGDRLPSIRELGRRQAVAIDTVKEAYYRLEATGVVELRPRSGGFEPAKPGGSYLKHLPRVMKNALLIDGFGMEAMHHTARMAFLEIVEDRLAFHSHRIEITGDTVRRKLYAVDGGKTDSCSYWSRENHCQKSRVCPKAPLSTHLRKSFSYCSPGIAAFSHAKVFTPQR